MAGAGWRRFQPGEVLTASNLQTYGIDQSVQVYAGTAARGSAIGTATSEGMMSYLADQDKLQLATSSSNWVDVYPSVANAGEVIQVVYNIQDTQVNTTTGYPGVTTNLSATITPKFNNSRMFIFVSQYVQPVSTSNIFDGGVGIFRNNTTDLGGNSLSANAAQGAGGALAIRHLAYLMREDYPNTTSPVSYNTRMWLSNGLRYEAQPSNQRSSITIMEVKV